MWGRASSDPVPELDIFGGEDDSLRPGSGAFRLSSVPRRPPGSPQGPFREAAASLCVFAQNAGTLAIALSVVGEIGEVIYEGIVPFSTGESPSWAARATYRMRARQFHL